MRTDPISAAIHRGAGEHGPVILMYHSVKRGIGAPAWTWAVSLQRFISHLDFLVAEGYATPTMSELVATPHNRGRTVVITFDDGYVDNLAAFEALEKRGMRATWFIVAGSLGGSPAWPADGRPPGRLLNQSELRQMQSAGMEIGSHSMHHRRLPTLDDEKLATDLSESKSLLEAVTAQPVSSFAYPYGAWDTRCAAAVKMAGYRAACTTRTGWALKDNDPYLLRRLTVTNTDTTSSLARKLFFGSHDVGWRDVARYAFRLLGWAR